ncbi:hypothetical protein QBC44DRAFT_370772 [Cladorrhinum sp. PSN332]|nr:hypothetical protein QBC44DRAFT_370772 [Cladorrhinum sp. PSN332]
MASTSPPSGTKKQQLSATPKAETGTPGIRSLSQVSPTEAKASRDFTVPDGEPEGVLGLASAGTHAAGIYMVQNVAFPMEERPLTNHSLQTPRLAQKPATATGTIEHHTQGSRLEDIAPNPAPSPPMLNSEPRSDNHFTPIVSSKRRSLVINLQKSLFWKVSTSTLTDWHSSPDLEAWITPCDQTNSMPTRLPLSRQELERSVMKLANKTASLLITMTPAQRSVIETVINTARLESPHTRILRAVQKQKGNGSGSQGSYIVFFSLAEPPSPIQFTDNRVRNFPFPFARAKIWENMRALIIEVFNTAGADMDFRQAVMEGKYDLILEGGGIILPALWTCTVRPGDKVSIAIPPIPPNVMTQLRSCGGAKNTVSSLGNARLPEDTPTAPVSQQDLPESPASKWRTVVPAIEPQFGDLLPPPPSELGSPNLELEDELPPLPDSRLETPARSARPTSWEGSRTIMPLYSLQEV